MNPLITTTLRFAGRLAPAGFGLCCGLLLFTAGCSKAPPPAPAGASTNAPAKPPASGASGAGNSAQAELLSPKSAFDFKPGNLDPFFPMSERLDEKSQTTAAQKVEPVVDLVVKTIIPGRTPRAWINNRSFVTGEEQNLRMPDGKQVRVKCVEIRDKSVIVEVEGVPGQKEVPLRMR